MLRIYLVRHGQTTHNLLKKIHGWSESELTNLGVQQAKRVGKELENVNFTACYCSDMQRAVQTAYYIIGDKNIPVFKSKNLREIHFGILENHDTNELLELDSYAMFSGFSNYYGEDLKDAENRLLQFLNAVKEKHREGNLLVVSHGRTIMTLLHLLDSSIENNFTERCRANVVKNCAISIIEFTNAFKIKQIGF